jgi:hypothetical protein
MPKILGFYPIFPNNRLGNGGMTAFISRPYEVTVGRRGWEVLTWNDSTNHDLSFGRLQSYFQNISQTKSASDQRV